MKVLTGGQIPQFQLVVWLSALKLESLGMQRSKKQQSVYSMIKKRFKLTGSKDHVYKQFHEMLCKADIVMRRCKSCTNKDQCKLIH